MPRYNFINGVRVQFTAEEEAFRDAEEKAWADGSKDRKLQEIRDIRNEKLFATDYMANSDYTMPSYIKTWRQSLRDIPTNYTTESKYDELLEKEKGKLKHTIWTQPTE